jgi:hypothetical protein
MAWNVRIVEMKNKDVKKKKKKQNLCGSTNVPTSIGRNN